MLRTSVTFGGLVLLAMAARVGLLSPAALPSEAPPQIEPEAQPLPRIVLNDNVEPAGRLSNGVLELELEIVNGAWHLLGDDRPGGSVLAFAEVGEAPSNPGPLVRVPVGTEIRVSVMNRADSAIVVRGFGDRWDGVVEPLRVEPGATGRVEFTADVEGTYFYSGSFLGRPFNVRNFEDSQLNGAFVVDGQGLPTDDRILVMTEWADGRLPDGAVDPSRLFLAVNGRPWPHTERMEYDLGDSIQWRVINTSFGTHAFHLHGYYYQISAKGDIARDTLYWPAERRMAVTERLDAGASMHISWVPNRPGAWIFHCHMNIHVVPNPDIAAAPMSSEELEAFLYRNERLEHDTEHHAMEGMGGLMTSLYVRPPPGWEPEAVSGREMDIFVNSRPARGGFSGSQFSYVLQEGPVAPAPDSMLLPAPTLFLREGEPTRIRVTNRTPEPTQVHWHGLEIESYYDGVAGVGGYPSLPTPVIQPGESWDVYVTPDRPGSYMYHSHVNDLRQQGSGLYGPLIVLGEDESWDPDANRIFVFGESPFRNDGIPVINGGTPTVEPLRVGVTYRFRLMQITTNRPATWVALTQDGFPVRWTPVAKDAFDLPPYQRVPVLAQHSIAVGETYDHLYTPNAPGTLRLEFRVGTGVLLVDQETPVVE